MEKIEVKMIIASRLAENRIKFKISRKLLSIWSNVSYSTIRRFEETGEISLDHLIRIADCLGGYTEIRNLFKNLSPSDPKYSHSPRRVMNKPSRKEELRNAQLLKELERRRYRLLKAKSRHKNLEDME